MTTYSRLLGIFITRAGRLARRLLIYSGLLVAGVLLLSVADLALFNRVRDLGLAARPWALARTTEAPVPLISAANVDLLEVAWTYRTGDVSANEDGRAGTAFEATPVLHGRTLYLTTPYTRVIALDAATGQERWTFDPGIDRSDRHHKMVTSRGVTVWTDDTAVDGTRCAVRVFAASYDARLFALDAGTGQPCAGFGSGGVINLRNGIARIEGREHTYWAAPPPTVVGDLVVMGSTIMDNHNADAPSGVVRAFDARSGALRWAWDPLPGVGAHDRQGQWVSAGAANTWATIVADPVRDLLFIPTSSPSPDHYGGLRPGPNAFANSIVALRASTGQVVWHFQTVHHDLWDYDLAAPPLLITIQRDGLAIPAVVVGTKLGFLFVFHRETGAPLFPIREVPVPASDVPGESASPTQPMPILPRPLAPQGLAADDAWGLTPLDRQACRNQIKRLRSDGVFTPPSLQGSVTMPGFLGGLQWGGAGWDSSRQLLVVNAVHIAMVATLVPRAEVAAAERALEGNRKAYMAPQDRTPYGVRREALLSPLGIPCNAPPWGTLAAIDLVTGEVRWEVPFGTMRDLLGVPTPASWGSPNLGGPVVTGGLAFIGATMDRRLRAFDVLSGEQIWEDTLPASAQATPLLYTHPDDGRQVIVIAAGGHSGLMSTLGDYVIAYALPAPGPAGAR
jgi:quinoprotein glucose dehydrogenase